MNLTSLKIKSALLFAALLAGLVVSGCSSPSHGGDAKGAASPAPAPIITPDMSLAAKVISVNDVGRFVVLSFPATQMPKIGQTLFLYRGGLKVAQVNVTGPQQDNDIVADIVTGDAQVGDNVRDE